MNFWIEGKLDSLKRTLANVDMLIINDSETRELARMPNLVKAANTIMSYGPKTLIVKRGEHGVLMFHGSSIFAAPAYPLEDVYDPTGAGDTFAGGFIGSLAHAGEVNDRTIRRAIIFGSVLASFNVEKFGVERVSALRRDEIDARFSQFKALTHFEEF